MEFISKIFEAHKNCPKCPSTKVINSFFEELLGLLFPEYANQPLKDVQQVRDKYELLKTELHRILENNPQLHGVSGSYITDRFFNGLPEIYDSIHEDVVAMYAGDPAARSKTEIIRSYPGFFAIAAYRIAHLLHVEGVSLIPRMITEIAHSRTGIDIHPGAKIGRRFCIDHGTGVVIGETTVIGNDVKVYQGVTLGALSVDKADADAKRHPTIEDHVVIYAGATILGGNTTIGARSVVGGNVWLTKSIPVDSKIYYQSKMYNANSDTTDLYILKSGSQ
ncbi:MAG TPA: serine O-acetyltransferase EpsC [Anditalea sp.]|nr:serine O-acetyltransferase EpsC [Anditalea sp.]